MKSSVQPKFNQQIVVPDSVKTADPAATTSATREMRFFEKFGNPLPVKKQTGLELQVREQLQSDSGPIVKRFVPKSLEEADARQVAINPHNFPHDINLRKADREDQKLAAANSLFDSTLSAQKNRVEEFEVAKLIHASPLAKKYLLTFGMCIADTLRACSSDDEFNTKKTAMFKFYRNHQAGGVSVDDNLFLQPDARSQVTPDATLRELGASLSQTVAIGENKEFLRMLKKISETVKQNPDDTVLAEKWKQHVDIDFFNKLCNECGLDDEGLPKTDAYRVKLYKENDDLAVRSLAPEPYRVKAYGANALQLSARERNFIKNEDEVKRATGGQLWRITPESQYAKKAIAKSRPTTSGPSGTTFHVVLAAKLMVPAMQAIMPTLGNQTDGPFDSKDYSNKLLMTTMMGYLHGEHAGDHHHSMDEVIQGGQHADKLIRACYREQPDRAASEVFGYDGYKTENLISEIRQKEASIWSSLPHLELADAHNRKSDRAVQHDA